MFFHFEGTVWETCLSPLFDKRRCKTTIEKRNGVNRDRTGDLLMIRFHMKLQSDELPTAPSPHWMINWPKVCRLRRHQRLACVGVTTTSSVYCSWRMIHVSIVKTVRIQVRIPMMFISEPVRTEWLHTGVGPPRYISRVQLERTMLI